MRWRRRSGRRPGRSRQAAAPRVRWDFAGTPCEVKQPPWIDSSNAPPRQLQVQKETAGAVSKMIADAEELEKKFHVPKVITATKHVHSAADFASGEAVLYLAVSRKPRSDSHLHTQMSCSQPSGLRLTVVLKS